MPKISAREKFLSDLELWLIIALFEEMESETFEMLGWEGFNEDSSALVEDLSEAFCAAVNSRFIFPKQLTPKSKNWVLNYFSNLPEEDLRQTIRMNFNSFHQLLNRIEDHPIFHNESLCPQTSVEWQLACALNRLGNYGNGGSLGRQKIIWGVGKGTVCLFTSRVIIALLSLTGIYLRWPDIQRRAIISENLAAEGFEGCIGFVDGTTFPLSQKPAIDGNLFWDRKHR